MSVKSNRKSVARNAKSADLPKTVETPVVETPVVATPAVETPAPVATEAPAPVVTDAPATEKVSWEATMKKAQASFAKTGQFREGTNRFVLYPLLQREEGVSLAEAAEETQKRGGKARSLSSIHTDLHDIAKITQRKLVRCDKGEIKRYRLASVAPAPVAMTETVASAS
jgi:hypothetical protein